MYIPSQQERYRKVASITLFLCVIIPSGIVYWLAGMKNMLDCAMAFLLPIAYPLELTGIKHSAALCFSAFVQACAYFWLARTQKLSPKRKLTLAVTWGMLFALLLKLFIGFYLWRRVTGQ